MARLIGPDEACRLVFITTGTSAGKALAQGLTATIYTDAALSILADITDLSGTTLTGSVVTVDAYSRLPLFKFPDGVDTLYTSVNLGPVVPLYARTDDRLDALGHIPSVNSAVLTDGTDQSTTLWAEVDALLAAGGGTLVLPSGTIRADSAHTLPNDGATPPKQGPLILKGQGGHWSGRGTAVVGGTVLDLRGSATYGKILTTGLGSLVIEDLTLKDSSGGSTPFLYTTNTTVFPQRVAFVGSRAGAACDQDAIILGGVNAIEGGGNPTDGFQGYGSVIKDCFFSGIRRAVYGRVYANAVIVRNNTVWSNCGFTTGAAFDFDGFAANNAGSVIAENLIELTNYKYGVSLANASNNTVAHNNMYDSSGTTTAAVRCESTALYNLIIDGFVPGALTALSDASVDGSGFATNTHITPAQSIYSIYASPARYTSALASEFRTFKAIGAGSTFTGQPVASQVDTSRMFQLLRSAAESSNASADVFYVQQNANIVVRGSSAGNLTFQDASGAGVLTVGGNGKTWTFPNGGGQVTIDTGTNGSYLVQKLFGLKLTKQDASLTVTLIPLNGTPEGATAQPVGSMAFRADGTVATGVLYVKEANATNAGWSAALTRSGIYVKEGTNLRQGVATLVGGTVTVACTAVTASSRIFLTTQSLGTVAVPKEVAVTARVVGTSFTITSADATDTSVVAYQICEPG